MDKNIRRIITILSCALGGMAQADDLPSEQDFMQDLPVVISASRLSQPISETPNAMTVITQETIKAMGVRQIADVFRLVPGMYVGYEAGGHSPIVAYRGSTDALARRMQVLVDGRTIYLPPLGQVDWSELPLDIDDIERIEVIRGPAAASHGSNSVQGVISILTRQSAGQSPRLTVRAGEGNVRDAAVRWGGGGQSWDYRVTLSSRGDSGFVSVNPDKKGVHDDNRSNMLNLKASFHPSHSDTVDVQLGYSDTHRDNGEQVFLNNGVQVLDNKHPNTYRVTRARNSFQQVKWLKNIKENNDLQLSYYRITRDNADDRPFANTSFWVMDDVKVERNEFELQNTLITSPNNRFVWGLTVRNDAVDAANSFTTGGVRWREYHLFAHDEWRINARSLLNTGVMIERNPLGQTRTSPRVAYNFHLTPQHTLRASASVAYRNPEMVEELGAIQYWRGDMWWKRVVASGGLSPERIFSREIGYIGQVGSAGRATVEARLYHDQLQDIIWVDPKLAIGAVDNRTNSFSSDFNAFHSGFESTVNYKLSPRNQLVVNYARSIAGALPSRQGSLITVGGRPVLDVNKELIRAAGGYKSTVPKNSLSLLWSQYFDNKWQFSSVFYYQDPVQILDSNKMQSSATRVDFRVAKRFDKNRSDTLKLGGEVALVVQNALDKHYTDYNENLLNQRRFFLTTSFGF